MSLPAFPGVPPPYLARVRKMLGGGGRKLLGLVGPPGAGKSTLALALQAAFVDVSQVVPLDGFHLANAELQRLGRAGRKGAPDTFDAAGYVALLRRLGLQGSDEIIYAPARWLDGPYACGLQIGEPAIVAAACQTVVVTQFRPMDPELGGTGAPLMRYLDYVAFRDIGPLLTLNIGGIANCQLADADRSRMMAFDTGPGNVMLDHVAHRMLGMPYDTDGEAASRGTVNPALLDTLLQHPYFYRRPPRSAWRLDFGADYADARIAEHKHLSADDLLATFTEFTAVTITRSITDHVERLSEIKVLLASGGGTRNAFLMRGLAERLPISLRVAMSDEFGIPAVYKEAIKFATLAHATVHHLANNIPAASGASRFGILGKIVLPPRLAKVG